MNISYDLWPIWCDYLEEQSQDTEFLRYVLQYQCWNYGYDKISGGIGVEGIGYLYRKPIRYLKAETGSFMDCLGCEKDVTGTDSDFMGIDNINYMEQIL